MRTAVVTLTIGAGYERLAKTTHPYLRAYASKLGSDFVVLSEMKLAKTHPWWEKLRIHDLLNGYERLIFLDTDVIVRSDCPNLFELVPRESFGGFDEASVVDRKRHFCGTVQPLYGQTFPNWDGRYYNVGVMVISREQQPVFAYPGTEHRTTYPEQDYINFMLQKYKVPTYDLPYIYNRMSVMNRHKAKPGPECYIIHYAGDHFAPARMRHIRDDVAGWAAKGFTLQTKEVCA